MSLIRFSVCLSDIPEEFKKTSEKNGKIYIDLCITDRRERDFYGNDHSIYLTQTKEERYAKKPRTYVGSGKLLSETYHKKKYEKKRDTDLLPGEKVPGYNINNDDQSDDLPF